jgi:hypothetical protein
MQAIDNGTFQGSNFFNSSSISPTMVTKKISCSIDVSSDTLTSIQIAVI